ncbi:F-box protein PP2-B10 [Abeliophyllum distichum]|uniref:F-box protein PP2-B10 n=1 Tax=Abeliophyllum distichum TaxID=126358 RepID=A0ABD1Q0X3_9LAMI
MQSFHIDKTTGKKCAMIGARKLKIFCGEIPEFWEWTSHKDSRFLTVAKLKQVLRFDIRGQIELKILSPKTTYAAYLVFGFTKSYDGSLWSTYGSIGFVDNDKDVDAHKRAITLHLIPGRDKNGNIAVMRPDRWMEVEIGNFYTDQEYNSALEARVWINKGNLKSGLIVEGIEFRSTNAKVVMFRKKKRESRDLFKP